VGYIEELRSQVGTRPLILVGAAVIIQDEEDRVLLQRRSDTGEWGIPGGFMEPGERVEDTARREVREETGLLVGALSLLVVLSGPGLYYQYPNGDEVHNVSVVYTTREYEGKPRADGVEGLEVRFFCPGELPEDISPPDVPALDEFCRRLEVPGPV